MQLFIGIITGILAFILPLLSIDFLVSYHLRKMIGNLQSKE